MFNGINLVRNEILSSGGSLTVAEGASDADIGNKNNIPFNSETDADDDDDSTKGDGGHGNKKDKEPTPTTSTTTTNPNNGNVNNEQLQKLDKQLKKLGELIESRESFLYTIRTTISEHQQSRLGQSSADASALEQSVDKEEKESQFEHCLTEVESRNAIKLEDFNKWRQRIMQQQRELRENRYLTLDESSINYLTRIEEEPSLTAEQLNERLECQLHDDETTNAGDNSYDSDLFASPIRNLKPPPAPPAPSIEENAIDSEASIRVKRGTGGSSMSTEENPQTSREKTTITSSTNTTSTMSSSYERSLGAFE